MTGFFAYGLASFVTLGVLGQASQSLSSPPLKTLCWYMAALCPFWVGMAGIFVIGNFDSPGSRFGEEWAWAWGLSHMAFFAPTICSWLLVRTFAGSAPRLTDLFKKG